VNIRSLARLAAMSALCAPLLAHALDETPLSMVYEATQQPRPTIPNAPQPPATPLLPRLDGCKLAVRNVEDVRPSKDSAGGLILMMEGPPWAVPMGAASVRTGDGKTWLKGAVGSLGSAGLSVPPAPPQEGVDVALRLAHTWTGGMNIHSHVVLQASFPAEGSRTVRRYHGFASKLNGWNANSEFMTTLNMGMQDALQRFAQDLQRACKGETL
jgi:hypothetical protein